jgi:GTP-binding protein
MFMDEAQIYVQGGSGGDGCVSFHREKYKPHGGPNGGDGAAGGDVVLVAAPGRSTLIELQKAKHYKAKGGMSGGSQNRRGAAGDDLEIPVPVGTVVKDETGRPVADLTVSGQRYVAARGGLGGRGNASLVGEAGVLPRFAEKGEPGQARALHLELKLVADVAIVGFPNAGKSTLIRRISRARPKVSDYPFTTTEPHLGVVEGEEIDYVVTDVPGLVPDAHLGKGMGTSFLRHVERAAVILYLADMSPHTGREPFSELETLEDELKHFNRRLMSRTRLVAANKMDLRPPAETVEVLRKECEKRGLRFFAISGETGEGIGSLLKGLEDEVKSARESENVFGEKITYTLTAGDDRIEVVRRGDRFVVTGQRVERIVRMTDWNNDEALAYLAARLRGTGVERILEEAGAVKGDEVEIVGRVFEYIPEKGDVLKKHGGG